MIWFKINYFFVVDILLILYNTTDINASNTPIKSEPIDKRVNGIEKYLVSLKTDITKTVKIVPIIININPGIPIFIQTIKFIYFILLFCRYCRKVFIDYIHAIRLVYLMSP